MSPTALLYDLLDVVIVSAIIAFIVGGLFWLIDRAGFPVAPYNGYLKGLIVLIVFVVLVIFLLQFLPGLGVK